MDIIVQVLLLTITFSLVFSRPFTVPSILSTTVISSNGLNVNQVISSGVGVSKNIQLYSRNSGKYLRLLQNSVDGKGTSTDPTTKLVLESVGFSSQVRLRSVDGTRYLCIADHGSLMIKTKQQSKINHCIFYQKQFKGYTAYQTKINRTWFMGVKNDGRPKSAKKTSITQRSTHFIEFYI